jgi:hypothetical protein
VAGRLISSFVLSRVWHKWSHTSCVFGDWSCYFSAAGSSSPCVCRGLTPISWSRGGPQSGCTSLSNQSLIEGRLFFFFVFVFLILGPLQEKLLWAFGHIFIVLGFLSVCLFWDRISLCSLWSPDRPLTHDLPASASWVLGLQACTNTPSSRHGLLCEPRFPFLWGKCLRVNPGPYGSDHAVCFLLPGKTPAVYYFCMQSWGPCSLSL